jgi:Arc/MetJ family transcription regulator
VAKTCIDIDEQLLAQAQRILGTATMRATVETALREVVRRDAAERFLHVAVAAFTGPPEGPR